jgi:hypothetical protein
LVKSVLPELKEMFEDDADYAIAQHYVVNKYDAKQFPDFDKGKEDMGLSRVTPFMPINPFKAHYCNPYYEKDRYIRTFRWNSREKNKHK